MYKANNKYVQIEEYEIKGGFREAESVLKEGTIISVGESVKSLIKKGDKVLFNSSHGKAMQVSIRGKKCWFVDEEIVLAVDTK